MQDPALDSLLERRIRDTSRSDPANLIVAAKGDIPVIWRAPASVRDSFHRTLVERGIELARDELSAAADGARRPSLVAYIEALQTRFGLSDRAMIDMLGAATRNAIARSFDQTTDQVPALQVVERLGVLPIPRPIREVVWGQTSAWLEQGRWNGAARRAEVWASGGSEVYQHLRYGRARSALDVLSRSGLGGPIPDDWGSMSAYASNRPATFEELQRVLTARVERDANEFVSKLLKITDGAEILRALQNGSSETRLPSDPELAVQAESFLGAYLVTESIRGVQALPAIAGLMGDRTAALCANAIEQIASAPIHEQGDFEQRRHALPQLSRSAGSQADLPNFEQRLLENWTDSPGREAAARQVVTALVNGDFELLRRYLVPGERAVGRTAQEAVQLQGVKPFEPGLNDGLGRAAELLPANLAQWLKEQGLDSVSGLRKLVLQIRPRETGLTGVARRSDTDDPKSGTILQGDASDEFTMDLADSRVPSTICLLKRREAERLEQEKKAERNRREREEQTQRMIRHRADERDREIDRDFER